MKKFNTLEYFRFFVKQFQKKQNGDFFAVMVYPVRGEAIAIKKHPDEMKDGEDIEYVYQLNKKESEFFRKNKELCNVWILLKGESNGTKDYKQN